MQWADDTVQKPLTVSTAVSSCGCGCRQAPCARPLLKRQRSITMHSPLQPRLSGELTEERRTIPFTEGLYKYASLPQHAQTPQVGSWLGLETEQGKYSV